MPDETSPKPFVFVLMPFSKEFDDVYEVGIKQASKDAGAYCERVDEQIFDGSILDRIYNQIAKADIIVADMTGRNPNVFYETGYAHALSKQVIFLTRDADDIPFDLKQYSHIVYGQSISYLKSELERRVRWCIQNPQTPLSRVEFNLEPFIDGKSLFEKPALDWKLNILSTYREIQIDFHNPTQKILPGGILMGLVIPPTFSYVPANPIQLPDGRILSQLQEIVKILPDGWTTIREKLYTKLQGTYAGEYELVVRIFTELGVRDLPLQIRLSQ